MKHIFGLTLFLIGFMIMIEFLCQPRGSNASEPVFAAFSENDSNKSSPELTEIDDLHHVVPLSPPAIVVPDGLKFWVMIICFIGDAISNFFGWKKRKPHPR